MANKPDTLTAAFLDLRVRLHNMARRILLDDEEAKDALQDTYLKLHDSLHESSPRVVRGMLVAVLRNVCIDRLRRLKVRAAEDLPGGVDPAAVFPDFEDMPRFEYLLTLGLSPLQRQIYDLVVAEHAEYDDVARRLGMSVDAVRVNMSRARKRIRENLKILNK